MNVTIDQLRSYIEAFHAALEQTAREFLPPEHQSNLFHASLLPARITGYVSTQFGVAIEYTPAASTTVDIVRGSRRIEDMICAAPRWLSNTATIIGIRAANITLIGGGCVGSFPFRLLSQDASVTLQDMTFEAGPWRRTFHYAQVFANRDSDYWSTARAEVRAKDEVLAALVDVGRAASRKLTVDEYIAIFKAKTVLVLGDYDDTAGQERLSSIASALSKLGYDPVLVKDIPDHPHHDLSQKVIAIGSVVRFVVIDDSSRSGHLFEVALCKGNSWVTILLRAGGIGGSWMTAGASINSNVIFELPYDPNNPGPAVAEATNWAEVKLVELKRRYDTTYPWRASS